MGLNRRPERDRQPTALPHFGELRRVFALINELGAKLAADPPSQLALARPLAGRENHGEFGRNLRIFGDDLNPAVRDVGDHAVARQCASPELYLGKVSARTTFALTTVR